MAKTVKEDIQKIKPVPRSKPETGIDTNNSFPENLLDAAQGGYLDTGVLENFSTVAQTREQIYSLIDTMAQDSTLNAIVESYAEDATETNDQGKIVWSESKDEKVSKYVNFLLEDLNIDKYIYLWTFSLVKYGDVYLRLYRQSDYGSDLLFGNSKGKDEILNESKQDKPLQEAVNLNISSKNDRYVHYVEMVPNPGEMFELTKFGKTVGYIKAPTTVQGSYLSQPTSLNRYLKMNKRDVDIYDATTFVHGYLEDNSSRVPEEVNIYIDNNKDDDKVDSQVASYKVKRGQSLLYNQFKNWRELSLLENSVLLNRLTKSSINRVMQVEVGDMPKAKVRSHVLQLKNLFAQKAAFNKDNSYQEYTNPGPMENIVVIPVHEGKGRIENFTMGGDVDPKQLTDLSWFQDKLFGGLRVPKQFFGVTDDSAGFSGGESLAIISSKYAKAVKRIQNTICQMITDLVNLFLIDKGMLGYVNRFVIRVQPPITKDEQERRADNDNRIRYISDVLNQFSDVDDVLFKLKLNKMLLSPVINDADVMTLLQEKIDELEEEQNPTPAESGESGEEESSEPAPSFSDETPDEIPSLGEEEPEIEEPVETSEETSVETETSEEDSYMPSPSELDIDMTQNV